MQTKSVLGAIGALAALLYCGGLAYYFLDKSGSVEGAAALGLGPTVLGLGAIGLLFGLWLVVKIVRMSGGPPSTGSQGRGPLGPDDGESSFDADAVVNRYLANQSAHGTGKAPAGSPTRPGAAANPTGFGRRSR